MDDLRNRLANPVQLTTDGLKVYAIVAMEAGLSDHVWSLQEIATLIDAREEVMA